LFRYVRHADVQRFTAEGWEPLPAHFSLRASASAAPSCGRRSSVLGYRG
jgi:hypothetical protein